MDKALFYHIADVIQSNRSWIEVIDTHDTIQWNYCLNGEFHHIDYQVITLRNYRNQYCWQKPHIWKINEHDLADGVRDHLYLHFEYVSICSVQHHRYIQSQTYKNRKSVKACRGSDG